MAETDLVYSRPAAIAEQLGDLAEDRHRFVDKRVLLTGERAVLATANGRDCLLDSLRLLVRICRNVDVALPPELGLLRRQARETAGRVAFGQAITFLDEPPDWSLYDAILSVGAEARPELPWTAINAHGWLARVSSGTTNLPVACGQDNPIAALAAASLGVAEVFKRLLRLKPERGRLLDGLAFDLFAYETGRADPGPELPDRLAVEPVVVGAGAIGNGIVSLLSRLPLVGRVWIVDPQAYGPENLGTCLLIGPGDVGKPKALVAAGVLRATGIDAKGYQEDLAAFVDRLGDKIPYPRVVITGLDNIEARHATQDLWPDLVIDGAIGAFGCQVSRHPWGEEIACLRCLFRRPNGEAAEVVASRATGLSAARTWQAQSLVVEADVLAAPAGKRVWLQERVGRPICSVVQEGVAQVLSDEQQRVGFTPSVPFVACLSAAMVAAELVKFAAGWPTPLSPRFQLDVLRGPAFGDDYPQERRSDCPCVARRRNIEQLRELQKSAGGSLTE